MVTIKDSSLQASIFVVNDDCATSSFNHEHEAPSHVSELSIETTEETNNIENVMNTIDLLMIQCGDVEENFAITFYGTFHG